MIECLFFWKRYFCCNQIQDRKRKKTNDCLRTSCIVVWNREQRGRKVLILLRSEDQYSIPIPNNARSYSVYDRLWSLRG